FLVGVLGRCFLSGRSLFGGSLLGLGLGDDFLAAFGRLFAARFDRGLVAGRRGLAALGRFVGAGCGLLDHRLLGGRFLGRSLGGFLGLGGLGGALLGTLLGLVARLALLRVVLRRALLDPRGIEEAGDAVGRLRADADPVARTVLVELHAARIVLGEQRIVGADLLQIAAVAGRTAVGHHDAVIRTLLGAAARKPDLHCHDRLPFQFNPLNSFLLEKILQVGRKLGAARRGPAEPGQAARGTAEAAHPAAAAEQRA